MDEIVTMIAVTIVIIGMFDQFASLRALDSAIGNEEDGSTDFPLIKWPVDEIVLRYGDTWNVECTCRKPIVWIPFEDKYERDPPNIIVSTYISRDIHGANLTIRNASALIVGRYYCVHSDKRYSYYQEDMVTKGDVSSIYVYVDDPYRLVVPNSVKFKLHRNGIIVFCKSSHPDILLELCYKTFNNCIASSHPFQDFDIPLLPSDGELYCRASGSHVENHALSFRNIVIENRNMEDSQKLTIKSNIGDFVPIGKTIHLTCSFQPKVVSNRYIFLGTYSRLLKHVYTSWKTYPYYEPAEIDKTITVREETYLNSTFVNKYLFERDLIIENVTLAHKKTYRCEASNGYGEAYARNFRLHVRETPDDFVILSAAHNRTTMNRTTKWNREKTSIEIIVHYKTYPSPSSFEWFKESHKIHSSDLGAYKQEITESYVKLKINQANANSTGNYTIIVHAGNANASYTMTVFVHDKPSLELFSEWAFKGNTAEFECMSTAYPLAEVSFMFQPCLEVPFGSCSKTNITEALWQEGTVESKSAGQSSVIYKLTANEPGIVYCKASNSEGSTMTHAYLLLDDVSDFMSLEIVHPRGLITVGDNVTLICSVVTFQSTIYLQFSYKGKRQTTSMYVHNNTRQEQFTLWNVEQQFSGDIDCLVNYVADYEKSRTLPRFSDRRFIEINVVEAFAPLLRSGEFNQTLIVDVLDPIQLECDVDGAPEPKILWFKDRQPFAHNMGNAINTTSIIISNASPMYSGLYECFAENKKGNITIIRNVIIRNSTWNLLILYGSLAFLLVLLTAFMLISLFLYKRMMQTSSTPNIEDGNFQLYNPDITLNEQVDLLPYNREYEFPKERLKFYTQLGIGAFGVVMKARATGIKEHEETTTVAVKIVKNKDNDDSMRALLSELKIMVHLGRHLNVVNLLGAVTKNISNHKLMVIVEYCPFGNIRDYLKKHRARFMDLMSRRTEEIVLSDKTDTSTDNEPSKPETPLRSINTSDLICWAAQVASGMEYLTSRNVMHGDLAARNILLCDENVVKICDFGLARTIYRQNVYKKNDGAVLPFKWLAIECIEDNVFTKRSDVWSYGIVLWELFSLGKVPYPGLEVNNELYRMLRDGYRMEKPQFANQDIYDVMLNCWAHDPHSRPSFKDLRCRFNSMMPEEMLDRLLRLNEPYLAMNAAASPRASLSEVRTSCAQDYMNVINSAADPNYGTPHDESNQEQDTMMDADRRATSNSFEQMQMSLNFVKPARNAIVEPGYMCMNKVPKTHRSLHYIDTQPSSSGMRHNNKAKVIHNPNTNSRSSYIEMKRVDKES